MRPEIADLTRILYPDLEDGENVQKYENIRGLSKNLLFFQHTWTEDQAGLEAVNSKSNTQEAHMTIALLRHLLRQGYRPNQITILTP